MGVIENNPSSDGAEASAASPFHARVRGGLSWAEYVHLRDQPAPKETPHIFKYQARSLLTALKSRLEATDTEPEDASCATDKPLMLALVDYHLGLNMINTEELTAGEKLLSSSVARLRPSADHGACIAALIDGLNQVAVVWSDWNEPRKAAGLLEEAVDLFKAFKAKGKEPIADPFVGWFDVDAKLDDGWAYLEGLHTFSTYYLAQVYGTLKLKDKSAELCKLTLQRQLKHGKLIGLTWALDCMTLAQYYHQNNAFPLAYQCLASSEHVLHSTAIPDDVADGSVSGESGENGLVRAKADLSFIWGKFYLAALAISAERRESGTTRATIPDSSDDAVLFDGLPPLSEKRNPKLIPPRPKIPDQFATTPAEARELFLAAITSFSSALTFFKIDGHVTDHVLITQDLSRAYDYFSRFEDDAGKRWKLHKRRYEMLSTLIGVANATAGNLGESGSFGSRGGGLSKTHFRGLVQQVSYEIATVLESMADEKSELLEQVEKSSDKDKDKAKKRRELSNDVRDATSKGIAFYEEFIKLFNNTDGTMPFPFEDPDDARTVMTARVRLAFLWSKLEPSVSSSSTMASLKLEKVTYLRNSHKQYEYVQKYHRAHGVPEFAETADVVDQMVGLMARQIVELQRS